MPSYRRNLCANMIRRRRTQLSGILHSVLGVKSDACGPGSSSDLCSAAAVKPIVHFTRPIHGTSCHSRFASAAISRRTRKGIASHPPPNPTQINHRPDLARIDRLGITGIRSFSDKDSQYIRFHSPLTLIVGYNGSGKTTIIECLKYATTGLLPPNTKVGGAFIYDSKLAGFKDVKAQVRLGFHAHTGVKMTVTRNMTLTARRDAKSTMKTNDCTLLIIGENERTTVSNRVADMDRLMPQYIGVSKAVLDNVIFCHQDESLWPMSEPAVLKRKFDEIFEALKYTAAVKNINEVQKNQKNLLAQYQVRHNMEKQNKEIGDKAQKRTTKLHDEIEEDRVTLERLTIEVEAAARNKTEKWQRANKAGNLVEELNIKQQRAQAIQSGIDRLLSSNLKILEESDQWLRTHLDQYADQMKRYEEESQAYQSQYNELKKEQNASQKRSGQKQTELGQHEAKKENHQSQLATRAQIVQSAIRTYTLRGYDGDLDEGLVKSIVERLKKMLNEKVAELDGVKQNSEEELRRIQAKLSELQDSRSSSTQAKLNAKQALAANEKTRNAKQNEAAGIKVDEGTRAGLQNAQAEVEAKRETLSQEFVAAEWDRQLATQNSHQVELENESSRLMKELKLVNKLAKDRAALDYAKNEVKGTQTKLDTMKSAYFDELTSVLEKEVSWNTLGSDFQTVTSQRANSVNDANNNLEAADVQLREVESKLAQNRATLNRKNVDFEKRHQNVLNSVTNVEDKPLLRLEEYPAAVEALEEDCKTVEDDLLGQNYRLNYYKICDRSVVDKGACHLCERPFASHEESGALKKIEALVKAVAAEKFDEELKGLKQALAKALAARSDYEVSKTLAIEIADLEKEIRNMDRTKTPLVRQCEILERTVADKESAQRDLKTLELAVKKITEYMEAMSKLEGTVLELSTQNKLSGSSMSSEEIDQQQSICEHRLRDIKSKISQITDQRDQAKDELTSLEIELPKITSRLNDAGYKLEKKQELLSSIEQLRKEKAELNVRILEADNALDALAPQISKEQHRFGDAQKRGRAKEIEMQSQRDTISDIIRDIDTVEKDIHRYIEDGGPSQLASCERAIQRLEEEQRRLEGELQETSSAHGEVRDLIRDADKTKRCIVDNIQYRKDLRDLDAVNTEISNLNANDAADDHIRLHRAAQKAEEEHTILTMKMTGLLSSINAKDKTLTENIAIWETDYKHAAQNYREARVQVGTAQAAIEDLGKYSGALEAAVMKFHALKMEEINRFASDLWQQTYQGSDIDSIIIRSENESAASKKNHDYRVVMVKGGAEMDMRGRCSAGQKVLASIIIRLALAECFGTNCGIIALDEPTTNLDQDNIIALARSLHELIKNRQQQANFQLLVITHDESFLREMKCQEFAETYFSVGRNNNQNSTISEKPITELMA